MTDHTGENITITIEVFDVVGDRRELAGAIVRAIEAGKSKRLPWWRRVLRWARGGKR